MFLPRCMTCYSREGSEQCVSRVGAVGFGLRLELAILYHEVMSAHNRHDMPLKIDMT